MKPHVGCLAVFLLAACDGPPESSPEELGGSFERALEELEPLPGVSDPDPVGQSHLEVVLEDTLAIDESVFGDELEVYLVNLTGGRRVAPIHLIVVHQDLAFPYRMYPHEVARIPGTSMCVQTGSVRVGARPARRVVEVAVVEDEADAFGEHPRGCGVPVF